MTEYDRSGVGRLSGAPRTGLVLSVRGRRAVVMLPGGAVERIRLVAAGAEPGDEVALPAGFGYAQARPGRLRPATLLAAATAFAMLIVVGLTVVPLPAVAHVSVEINPTVTLAVDRLMRVVEVVEADELASELLAGTELRRMSLGDVVSLFAGKAAKSIPAGEDYWLILGAAPAGDSDSEVGDWILPHLERVKARAQTAWAEALGLGADSLPGTVMKIPAAIIDAAHAAGIAPGRYSLLLAAEDAGVDLLQLDSLKTSVVVDAIKDAGLVPGEVFHRAENEATAQQLLRDHGNEVKEAKDKENQGKPGKGQESGQGGSGGKEGKSG